MSSLKYWVWLANLSGLSAATSGKLLEHFGTAENIFNASDKDFFGVTDLRTRKPISPNRQSFDDTNKILATCAQKQFQIITIHDKEYPERLKNIYDPPMVIYVQGTLPDIDEEPIVSIVGTRRCTPYGVKATESIALALAERGIIVATGLALGIDTAAAYGALRGNGVTIGVIGSGLDVIYPPSNKKLFEQVAHRGAVVSEYPPGTPPLTHHFPARNRIISGFSLGVTVIEAPQRSGALITAERAMEQGRDVFVLPGNVDEVACVGSNLLLRDGAIPILSADDIISEYDQLYSDKIIGKEERSEKKNKKETKSKQMVGDSVDYTKNIDNNMQMHYIDLSKMLDLLSGDEKIVANAIGCDTMHIDDIITKTNLPTNQVLTALTMLEINGSAICEGSKYFRLKQA